MTRSLKIGAALALIAGIWLPALVLPAAALICILMLGARAMHAKIGDPFPSTVTVPAQVRTLNIRSA